MTVSHAPLAGVIGWPVAHSLSPKLFRHWLTRLGISGHYVPLPVAHDDLPQVLRSLPQAGFVGANVTIPHKVSALNIADQVSDRASVIGAANTLTFHEGRIYADNTDGIGFLANLRSGAPDWKPDAGPALVFGAGGAARAVLSALLGAGVTDIRLTNRTTMRAEALQSEFGNRIQIEDWNRAADMVGDAALVVNTTSLGMTGKAAFSTNLQGLRPGTVVTDLVYTPLETEFLRTARNAGCTVVDGLGMLLHQAVPGFERWFGATPSVDDDTRAVVLGS